MDRRASDDLGVLAFPRPRVCNVRYQSADCAWSRRTVTGRPGRSHHQGDYQVRARLVRQAANANPLTRCWRCGRTLAQHPPHRNGRPATWQAGHVVDSDPASSLAPEASTCNMSAGATYGNARREPRSEDW